MLVELLLELLCCHVVGAEVVEVASSEVETVVGFCAEVEGELHGEQTVGLVLYVLHGQAFLGLAEGDVALEVDEHGGDRLYL